MIAANQPDPTTLAEEFVWLAERMARTRVDLRRRVGDDEVLSSALSALWDAARAFVVLRQGEGGFEGYASRCIANRLVDCDRLRATRQWNQTTSPVELIADESDGIDGCPGEIVRGALKVIGEPHASVLVARFGLDGSRPMTIKGIASARKCAPGTVSVMIRRALQRMREAVAQMSPDIG